MRKSYPGSLCYLLGELIQDTEGRYYYRRRLGAKLAFVIGKSPSTSCHARRARTGSPANDPHRQKNSWEAASRPRVKNFAPAGSAESARGILRVGGRIAFYANGSLGAGSRFRREGFAAITLPSDGGGGG